MILNSLVIFDTRLLILVALFSFEFWVNSTISSPVNCLSSCKYVISGSRLIVDTISRKKYSVKKYDYCTIEVAKISNMNIAKQNVVKISKVSSESLAVYASFKSSEKRE